MTPGEVLDHTTRSRLLDLISSEPGLSLMEIVSTLGLKESTLRYHLKYLERKQMVESDDVEGKKRYFSSGARHLRKRERKEIEIGLSERQKRLLSMIDGHPGIDQKRICIFSKLNRFVISYHLDKLEKLGLIRKKRTGKNVQYFKIDEEELRKRIISAMVEDLSQGRMDEERFLHLMGYLEEK